MVGHLAPSRLRLIGDAARIDWRGRELLLEPKDALLLGYVAIEGPTPRRVIAGLLWPEVEEDRALANLRQRLYRLRRALGFDAIGGGLVLALASGVEVDLEASVSGGELLGHVGEGDCGGLAAWLAAARQRRRSGCGDALAAAAAALEANGELAQALALSQQRLDAEPMSEHAHRQVMRLHYLRGDRAAALLAFDRCEQMLKDDVGARPSPETLALLDTIEKAAAPAWVRGQPLPASVLRPPQMVGRQAERTAAQRAWAAGEVFLVTGPAGIGKSRLLGDLFDARPEVLVARARPGDEAVPMSTLLRFAESLAEGWPAARAAPAYALLLEHASGSGLDPLGAIRAIAPLGVDLLRAAESGGLAGVVLDDLQFADDASVDAWSDWLDRPALAALRFGFASRFESRLAEERIERLRQRDQTVVVAVPPLAAGEAALLVEQLGLAGTDVPVVSSALVERIGGNPLHLLETIRGALETDGRLHADRLDAPVQVLDLLERRLTSLSAEGLLLVRIAAVASSDFSPELAQAVSRRDVLELADAWSVLEHQGILDARGLAHDLMLEAALRLLPRPIRRVIHARVAEFIVDQGAAPARLAHHWLRAEEPIAALPHLLAAAHLAWRSGRGRESREAFLQAADIEVGRGHRDAAFDVLFECAQAAARLCAPAEFEAVVARLASLARTDSHRARVMAFEASLEFLRGDVERSNRILADAMLLAIACGDRWVEAECLSDRAYHSWAGGRLRDALEQLSACAALQHAAGLDRLAYSTEVSKLTVLRMLGQVRAVHEEQRPILQWLTDHGDPVDVVAAHLVRVLAPHDLGLTGTADAEAPAAWRAMCETDLRANLAPQGALLLRFHRQRGHWGRALHMSSTLAQRLVEQGQNPDALADERAALYLDLGRPELAGPHIEAMKRRPQPLGHTRFRSTGVNWRYHAATGTPVGALSGLDELLASEYFPLACELTLVLAQVSPAQLSPARLEPLIAGCKHLGLLVYLLPLQALRAWLLARDGDRDAAASEAAQAQPAILVADLGAALPACCLWLGQTLQTLGRQRDAAAVCSRAAGWLRQCLAESVPGEFHESFRFRNPIHRDLLALARQVGSDR